MKKLLYICSIALAMIGCARMGQPDGGWYDDDPPKVLSATPADYELEQSEGVVVEQLIRPTGLPDPVIEVRPTENQVDDLMEEIQQRVERDERTLVTTLTKRMAEELADYLLRNGIRTAYIHSDVDTLERVQILNNLREGQYDVLVGVNLLREGLDLPEVSLVAILDADKEGFLRSHRSLTQTVGRAARNLNGKAIMYGDIITESMQKTITLFLSRLKKIVLWVILFRRNSSQRAGPILSQALIIFRLQSLI